MLRFGVIGRPHGVRGEAVLHPFNPGGFRLHGVPLPLPVELRSGSRRTPLQLTSVRPFGESLLVRAAGVDDRDAAAKLTGLELFLPREVLPPLEPGEAYIEDLMGFSVFDQHGRARGVVESTFWNGGQDILTIVGTDGAELLIPAVPAFLLEIDLDARRLVIDDHE